ncbi:UNVERIFIED_CONTAM: Sfmbt [Trichonephila clavipes]
MSLQDENTDTNGALGGLIQVVLFWCLVLEKISKKVRDADGSGTSQAPALAKVSAISFPLDLCSFDWKSYLAKPDFFAASVSCFPHVPLSRSWDAITASILVEVKSPDCTTCCTITPCCYWIAAVIKVSGMFKNSKCLFLFFIILNQKFIRYT